MLRRILFGGITILMLFGVPSLGHAQVTVNIGINLPAPPAAGAGSGYSGHVRAQRGRQLLFLRE